MYPDPEVDPERDRAAVERDEQAAARDTEAVERDARAQRRSDARRSVEQGTRDELWHQHVTRSAAGVESAPSPGRRDLLEQALVDREIALSDADWARQTLSDFVDAARRNRGEAAGDREASACDRHQAAHDRDQAADDRASAARDRSSAAARIEQAEVDAATRGSTTGY